MAIVSVIITLIILAYAHFTELRDIYGKIVISFMISYLIMHVCFSIMDYVTFDTSNEVASDILFWLILCGALFLFLWLTIMITNSFLRFK